MRDYRTHNALCCHRVYVGRPLVYSRLWRDWATSVLFLCCARDCTIAVGTLPETVLQYAVRTDTPVCSPAARC